MSDITIVIKTHELSYVMNELMDEYFRTWNPFKKKRLKKIMNRFHKYMFPWDKENLFKMNTNKSGILSEDGE